jgi:hypothetical protein
MSFTKKIVTTYSKSLFQNVNKLHGKTTNQTESTETFDISHLTSSQIRTYPPTVYILGEELSFIRSIINSSQKGKDFFQNPTLAESQKLEILFNIFPGLTVTMKSFLRVLAERSHLFLLPEVSEEYNKILLAFKKSSQVKIITASILQENYGITLLEKLKSLTNSVEVVLNVSYNPKLLGGFILEYNSSAIDASILKEFSLFFNEV